MSYASVAATNTLPLSEQPHPDPALLNTTPPSHDNTINETDKISIVAPDFKDTLRSPVSDNNDDDDASALNSKRGKVSKGVRKAEAEGAYIWQFVKRSVLQPGVAGGLIGILNIGLIANVGRAFYIQPRLRRDTIAVTSTIIASVALLSAEGYAAERYRRTARGQKEERRAKREGAAIYRSAREHILRPGILGGVLGFSNVAVLSVIGYISYLHWHKPAWDRRIVSAVSISLMALWGGETLFAERVGGTKL